MSGPAYVFAGVAQAGSGTHGGVFRRSLDGPWEQLSDGLPEANQVQAITVHPTDENVVYLGTHNGPYRSLDGGNRWERLDFPDDGTQVWSVLVHPGVPRVMYAGTSPVGVFRSDDGGDHWHRLAVPQLPERVKMEFPCRVMRLAVSAAQPDEVFATLEVGGAVRSLDAGQTWEDCSASLIDLAQRPHLKSMIQSDTDIEGMMDGHALCVSEAAPGSVFLAVRMGLFRSDDRGVTWDDMEVGRFSPLTYSRDVRVSPQDARVLYLCLSPAARSLDGSLYRSDNLGKTWSRFDRNVKAEATMMAVALSARDADQVHCASRCGQVFSTLDGGRTWEEHRLPAGARDLYALACS
jgi:photosystem II stability/assembly factor-like uncharacterized protein